MELFALFAVLVAGALVRLAYLRFPMDDDLGLYFYTAQFRDRGVRLVKDYYARFPLLWFYRFVYRYLGRGAQSVRTFDLFYELTVAVVLFAFGWFAHSPGVGILAAACYLWFGSAPSMGLFSGTSERYYALTGATGFLCFLLGLGAPMGEGHLWFLFAGLCFGANVIFKDVLLVEAMVCTAALATVAPHEALWFLAGFASVAFVVYPAIIHYNGGVSNFFRFSFQGYRRAFQDNAGGRFGRLRRNGLRFLAETAPLWVTVVLGALTLAPPWADATGVVMLVWLVAAIAVLCAQGVYWPYHFTPFVPLMSVWSAVTLARLAVAYGSLAPHVAGLWWSLLLPAVVVSLYIHIKGVVAGSDPHKHPHSFSGYKLEQLTAVPRIAEYIKERTSPDDYIYQWGYLYHLYALADRMCPVWGWMSLDRPALPWKVETLKSIVGDLRKRPPTYFVVYLQSIDMRVLEELTGLGYELEKVFSLGLRVYRLARNASDALPAREVTPESLEALLTNADRFFEKGIGALHCGEREEADRLLDLTLTHNPAHLGALFVRAKVARGDGDYALAKERLKALVAWDDPGFRREAAEYLLQMSLATGDADGIEHVASSVVEGGLALKPYYAYHVARHFIGHGDGDRALEVLLRQPDFVNPIDDRSYIISNLYHAGRILLERDEHGYAIKYLEQCLRTEPGHREAERLLERAKEERDSVTDVRDVLMFGCAPNRSIRLNIDAVKRRFPGCRITLLVQEERIKMYRADRRLHKVVAFPFHHFSNYLLLLPSVRRLLRSVRADVAVLPVTVGDRTHAYIDYFNVLLYAGYVAPRRILFFRTTVRTPQRASLGTAFSVLARKTYETLMMPWWVMTDLYRLWRHPASGDIVSLIQEPNDMVAHNVKARWMKKNGLYGVAFNSYMGNPYTFYYPPLSLWLLGRIGTVPYTLLQIVVFGAAVAGTAIASGNPWLLPFVPYIALSMPFRLNALIVGRLDFLSWGLVLAALTSYHFGHPLLAAVCYSLAVLGHTTVAILGGMGLAVLSLASGRMFPDMLWFGATTVALTVSWWWPFLKNRKKFGFHKIWSGIEFWDRVYMAYRRPLRHFMIFFFLLVATGNFTAEYVPLLVPMGISLFGYLKKKYLFHGVNLVGAMLTFGAFAVMLEPTVLTLALFLLMINFPDPQDNPRLVPAFETPLLEDVKGLFAPVAADERVALECRPRMYWDDNLSFGWLFNMAANRYGFQLMSGVGFDQVDPTIPLECEIKVNAASRPEDLKGLLQKTGCKYVTAYTHRFRRMLEATGFTKVSEVMLPSYGYLLQRAWAVYRAPFAADIVEPAVEWHFQKNGLRFTPRAAGEYRIKLAHYPGWQAVQDGRVLPLEDDGPGMRVTVNGATEVQMRFRPEILPLMSR